MQGGIHMSTEEKKIATKHNEHLSNEESNEVTHDNNAVGDVSRRTFLRLSALAGAGVSVGGPGAATLARAASLQEGRFEEATVAELQEAMGAHRVTSVALTNFYINRIRMLDQKVPGVNSVIELNPDALSLARDADAMRRNGTVLGPLHGIPILLKDNIDTGDG